MEPCRGPRWGSSFFNALGLSHNPPYIAVVFVEIASAMEFDGTTYIAVFFVEIVSAIEFDGTMYIAVFFTNIECPSCRSSYSPT